jgi:hypothetical protein
MEEEELGKEIEIGHWEAGGGLDLHLSYDFRVVMLLLLLLLLQYLRLNLQESIEPYTPVVPDGSCYQPSPIQ